MAFRPEYAESIYEGTPVNVDGFYALAEQANEHMANLLTRLSSLTDTLCGSPPESSPSGQGIRPVANGHFDGAADNCRQMLAKIDTAHNLLQRIESKL